MQEFRPSDFATLLDELMATRDAAAQPVRGSIDYLSVVEELHSGRIAISPAQVAAAYEAGAGRIDLADDVPAVEPTLIFPDTSPEAVTRDLSLRGTESSVELDAARRRFALSNHPDCVAPELRQHAMTRMQIANMLIDEAKAKLRKAVRQS